MADSLFNVDALANEIAERFRGNLQLSDQAYARIADLVVERLKDQRLKWAPVESPDECWDTKQTAAFLECSTQKLERARLRGFGGPPWSKPTGTRQVRYSRRAVEAWLEGGKRTSTFEEGQ